MKLKNITIIFVLFMILTTNVFANTTELPYEYEKYYIKLTDMATSDDRTIVAVGTNGSIYTCTDNTWTEVEFSIFEDFINVEYGNGCFYILSDYSVYSSANGITWSKVNNICYKDGGMFFFNGSDFVIELMEKDLDEKGMLIEKNLGVFLTDNFIDFKKIVDSPNDNSFANIDLYKNYNFLQTEENYKDPAEIIDILFNSDMDSAKGISRKIKTFFKATGVKCPVNVDEVVYLGKCNDGYEIFYILNYNLVHAVTSNFITWNETYIDLPNKSEHLYYVSIMYNNGYYIKYHTNERYEYSYTTNIVYSDDLKEFNIMANIDKENGSLFVFSDQLYLLTNAGISKLDGNSFTIDLQIESQKSWSTIKYSNGKYIKWEYNDKISVYMSDDGKNWSRVENPDSSLTYLSNVNGEAFYDVLWDGTNYIIRPTNCDNGYNPTGEKGRLFICDSSLNLIKEIPFDNYILDMSYENGTYNILTNVDNLLYTSNDLENWKSHETNMSITISNNRNSIIKQLNKAEKGYSIADFQTKVKIKDGFDDIIFENYQDGDLYVSGEYYVKLNNTTISLSDDGVYWHAIQLPSGIDVPKSVYAVGNILYIKTDDVELQYDITNLYNNMHTYVKVDDKVLGFDTEPIIESDRILVPLRFIFETLGADVNWENSTRTAIVQNDEATILFSIDNTTASVNSVTKSMDVPARLVNDKTMVPLRFLSEELGFNVVWDEVTRTATISK